MINLSQQLSHAKQRVLRATTPQDRFRWLVTQAVVEGALANTAPKVDKPATPMLNYKKHIGRTNHV